MCESTNFDTANVSSRVCGYCNDLMFVYLFICLFVYRVSPGSVWIAV